METQVRAPEEIANVWSTSDRLQIRLFGGVDLQSNGLPLRRARSRTEMWLLALLILRANQSVERSWLAGVFWPESREAQALNNLRRSLSNLRQVLGEEAYRLLTPTQHSVAFDLADAFCDVTAFDNALAGKDNASLRRAVELYRGPLLPDCDADWLLPERRAREQDFLTALETLAQQAIQNGDTPEAVRFLRQILRVEPFRETTHRALLEALASMSDKAGMTLAYRQLRLLLHDELQSEPSAETKALYQRLQENVSKQSAPPSGPQERPTSTTPSAPPHRIPFPVSELIGREWETQEVASLLMTHRLVTLTGSGGIGKTRLALSVATRAVLDFPAGIWFVDLSPVTDPAQVVSTLSHVLEVREQEGQSLTDALLEHLRGRRVLLILDNAEHVLASCATLTARLLENLSDLQALVTSRMPLGVAGEQVWRVPSLPCPDPSTPLLPDSLLDYAGPRLFVTRALSASSAFVLTPRNTPAILQICARLDGIPLALELAAARVASLSVEQIAARLEDVFRLLTTGPRTALPRHQTLRALVDWSYALLPEPEKRLLSRLSVFAGGWSLEAAESVCGFAPLDAADVLDLLTSLVDKSLVLAEAAEGTMRYRMLETLRQYGAEKLDKIEETEQVQRRHRDYFLALVEDAHPKLRRSEQTHWLSVLEAEHDNLCHALSFSLEDTADGEVSLRLATALSTFWEVRCHLSEGRRLLTLALSQDGAQAHSAARADALNRAGVLAWMQDDDASARSLYEESLAMRRELGDRGRIAYSLNNLGNLTRDQGDYTSAHSLYEEGLVIFRELGEKNGIAASLVGMATLASMQDDYDSARLLYEKSLTIFRELGEKNGMAYALHGMGDLAFMQGHYISARSLCEESLAIFREVGNKNGIALCVDYLGSLARDQGDYSSAHSLYAESLTLRQDLGRKRGIAHSLETYAALATKEERWERSVRLWGVVIALHESLSYSGSHLNREKLDNELAPARASLSAVAFAAAWEVGRRMSWEQAAAYALEE